MARAIAMRCFCPPERPMPDSPIRRVIPHREPLDELPRVSGLGRPHDVVEVGLLLAKADVAGDGVVEQVILLQHEPDLPPEIRGS